MALGTLRAPWSAYTPPGIARARTLPLLPSCTAIALPPSSAHMRKGCSLLMLMTALDALGTHNTRGSSKHRSLPSSRLGTASCTSPTPRTEELPTPTTAPPPEGLRELKAWRSGQM
jgi:hypothetical protein